MRRTKRSEFNSGRRRALKILAAGSLAAVSAGRAQPPAEQAFTWRGTALGARATLTFYGVGEERGRRLVARIDGEVRRLEHVFSLYRADSAVSVLNRDGVVDRPPLDLLRLMSEAHAVSEATSGGFDVTVQPLWRVYADPFGGAAFAAEPDPEALHAALELVGYRDVRLASETIRFGKAGMAVTLNGIAQGYITDRVADLLRGEGLSNVLVDLGEIRALGAHPDGRPWSIGLEDPDRPGGVTGVVDIENKAVATSAGSGTRFGGGPHHHIFDPVSGRSSVVYARVSVIGQHATVADALSTGLYNLPPERARAALSAFPGYSARVVYADGRRETWAGEGPA